jgi:two-component SAPR family response regulator
VNAGIQTTREVMMNQEKAVLLINDIPGPELPVILREMGFSLSRNETMQEALHAVNRKDFAAIFLHLQNHRIDALEFVLNVRDIDRQVPIFVVYAEDEEGLGEHLLAQRRVFRITVPQNKDYTGQRERRQRN